MKTNSNSFAVNAQVLSTLIEVLTMGNLANVILVKESKKEKIYRIKKRETTKRILNILAEIAKIILSREITN